MFSLCPHVVDGESYEVSISSYKDMNPIMVSTIMT